jgi:hypothetical protein
VNEVHRRVFGAKSDEMTGGWWNLNNEELNNLLSSDVIVVIKSAKLRLAGHVERMGAMNSVYTGLIAQPEGRKGSEDLRVDGRVIFFFFFSTTTL